ALLAQLVVGELAIGEPQRLLLLRELAARQLQLLLWRRLRRRALDIRAPGLACLRAHARRVGVDLAPHRVHGLAVARRAPDLEDRDRQVLVAHRRAERLAGLLAIEALELVVRVALAVVLAALRLAHEGRDAVRLHRA